MIYLLSFFNLLIRVWEICKTMLLLHLPSISHLYISCQYNCRMDISKNPEMNTGWNKEVVYYHVRTSERSIAKEQGDRAERRWLGTLQLCDLKFLQGLVNRNEKVTDSSFSLLYSIRNSASSSSCRKIDLQEPKNEILACASLIFYGDQSLPGWEFSQVLVPLRSFLLKYK